MKPTIASVVIESASVEPLVEFWAELLSAPSAINPETGWGSVMTDQFAIAIKPVESHELPGLEKGSRIHFDIMVDDLEEATRRALDLGAAVKRGPFGELESGAYTVFADIDGNAFCLYTDPNGEHRAILDAIRNGTIGS